MKKITVVLNGACPTLHVVSTAIALAGKPPSLLHGVFIDYSNEGPGYPFPNDLSLAGAEGKGENGAPEDDRLTAANMQVFRDECAAAGVACTCESYPGTVPELFALQSACSDLIVTDAETGPGNYSIEEMVDQAHCPIYLVAKNAGGVRKIFLAYDGAYSSIHALKMYSYLFPEWRSLPTCLLSVQALGPDHLKKEPYLKDWLPLHFSNLHTQYSKGNVAKEVVRSLQGDAEHSLLVMGADGRGTISRFFRDGLAGRVVKETDASLFIVHER